MEEQLKEFMEKHINWSSYEHDSVVSYDNEALVIFEKSRWYYITKKGDQPVHNMMRTFDSIYIPLFIEDLSKQLMDGVDRNLLKINIPKEIKYIKIGEELIEWEI